MWTISSSELEKGFKEWLEKIHNTGGLELKIKFFTFKNFETELSTTKAQNRELQKWGEVEISIEELTKMVLGEVSNEIFSFNSKGGVLWISPEPKSEPVQEKKLETFHIVENREIVDNLPKGLIQCEHCARQGKPLFFASKHDLDLHVKAFHGGYPDKAKPEYVR